MPKGGFPFAGFETSSLAGLKVSPEGLMDFLAIALRSWRCDFIIRGPSAARHRLS